MFQLPPRGRVRSLSEAAMLAEEFGDAIRLEHETQLRGSSSRSDGVRACGANVPTVSAVSV